MKNEYECQHRIIQEKRKVLEKVIDEDPEYNNPLMLEQAVYRNRYLRKEIEKVYQKLNKKRNNIT